MWRSESPEFSLTYILRKRSHGRKKERSNRSAENENEHDGKDQSTKT